MTATRLVPLTPIAAGMRAKFYRRNGIATLQDNPNPQKIGELITGKDLVVLSCEMDIDLSPTYFTPRYEFYRELTGHADKKKSAEFPDLLSVEVAVRDYHPSCDPYRQVVFGRLQVFNYDETVHILGEIFDTGFFLKYDEIFLKPGFPLVDRRIRGRKAFEATISLCLEMFLQALPKEEYFVGEEGIYNSVFIWGEPSKFARENLNIDLGVRLWRLEELLQ